MCGAEESVRETMMRVRRPATGIMLGHNSLGRHTIWSDRAQEYPVITINYRHGLD
jgi:hypothetical protein